MGKQIYITRKEAEAIWDAFDQVRDCAEAADQEYSDNTDFKSIINVEKKLARSGIFTNQTNK